MAEGSTPHHEDNAPQVDREGVSWLLRKALQMIEQEVRAGAQLRESDALVRLALAELTAIKREDDE